MNGEEALQRLIEGNKRYVENKGKQKDYMKREELRKAQHPFATIVSCSDSRVVPEYIFDAEIGELFIIRVAGNVVDDIALASIEYGIEHLGTPLLVVLGHESCGAVTSAYNAYKNKEALEGVIKELLEKIKPSVLNALRENKSIEDAISFNVKNTIDEIRIRLPVVKELEEQGKLKVVSAKYYFDGKVEFEV